MFIGLRWQLPLTPELVPNASVVSTLVAMLADPSEVIFERACRALQDVLVSHRDAKVAVIRRENLWRVIDTLPRYLFWGDFRVELLELLMDLGDLAQKDEIMLTVGYERLAR